MAWWKEFGQDPSEEIESEAEDEEYYEDKEEISQEESESKNPNLVFREREEIASMGQNLYRELLNNTSNKGQQENIKKNYEISKKLYIDEQFPAGPTSLCQDWLSSAFLPKKRKWKAYQWKRVSEIFKNPMKLFNNIDPNDILQGTSGLGDCYFLSTLSSIAEFPKRIEKLFDTQDYQPSGCYKVKICDMGMWTEYIVDDFFPCDTDNKIVMAGSRIEREVSELWVLLLEKAWAKRFGSYWAIDGGFAEHSLRDLTGGPCEVIQIDDESLWDRMFEANDKKWIICANSTEPEGTQDSVNPMGLVMGHAYAVIDTQLVKSRRGEEQILQIRNPWGEQEWAGDWSDSSDLWTPQLKTKLKWSNTDDGTFWIGFEDFVQYFVNVTICRVHDNFFYEGIHHTQGQGLFAVHKVTLTKPGDTYFITTQVDERRFNEEDNYQFSPVRIIIGKLNTEKGKGRRLTFINGVAGLWKRDNWTLNSLEAGTYLVYVQMDWIQNLTEDYGFAVYSESPIKLEDVTFQEENFLFDVYNYNLAKLSVEPSVLAENIYFYQVERCGVGEDGNIKEGILFDVIRNKADDAILELQILHKTLENVELLGDYEGKDSYKFRLKPGEKKVVVKRQIDISGGVECPIKIVKKIMAI